VSLLSQIRNRFGSESPAPELVPAVPEVSREDTLLTELHDAERVLTEHNEAMRTFRQKHFIFVDGRVCIRSPKIGEGGQIGQRWIELGRERMGLLQKRNKILEAWSEVKKNVR
jgi:hypothetical protein